MSIRIIADSTCDLDPALCKELGITFLPLTVSFGDQCYRDALDITRKEFYARLRESEQLPVTSQVNPAAYLEAFERAGAAGDEILVLTLASQLSGTYQSACIARDQYSATEVRIVDSGSVAVALGILVLEAQKQVRAGKSLDEVADYLEEIKRDLIIYACVDTLTYLQKGGRLSTTSAFVGGLLNIKPVLSIQHGKIEVVHKAHGFKAATKWMQEKVVASGINSALPIGFAHASNPDGAEKLAAALAEQTPLPEAHTLELGAVIGTYSGPNAVGIAYFTPRG